MFGDIEDLVLSGKLFNGGSRSSSPVRTPSPDSKVSHDWPQLEKDDDNNEEDLSDVERNKRIASIMRAAPQDAPDGSIGMGPGRTGVKGVIRDRDEANERARESRARSMKELNARMKKANLGGKTFLEEERERQTEEALREGRPIERKDMVASEGKTRFGHLREVGVKNFVSAVEKEARDVFVIVHLYDPSLERCYNLDSDLSRLARIYPDTKFLRARATSLGFASTSSSSKRVPSMFTSIGARETKPIIRSSKRNLDDDDDDPYSDGKERHEDDEEENDDGDVEADVDVLPTMLVYRAGELEHTWVRVDWEAGNAGIDDLLSRHHILRGGNSSFDSSGFTHEEEELWASDPEV